MFTQSTYSLSARHVEGLVKAEQARLDRQEARQAVAREAQPEPAEPRLPTGPRPPFIPKKSLRQQLSEL